MTLQQQIRRNRFRSGIVLAGFVLLLLVLAGLVGLVFDVSLGVVASAFLVALGAELADPLIGLAITLVILKITWDSWLTVRHSHH